ncbi:hypothetical protein [Anaerotignum sp. MB30-C6]|uniref:hypothetical protein n=1 Tax=Anaerotignum sp. MB30-C6 TaxID=3070814 RepID=UPI0027DC4C69|nr:hypothetical protein [Anaerotignum sp. MB30-C6]WMI82096.1 hypothetical protein RBQ60_05005 [Anaerotignum sp. MB30-C6]
MEKIVLGSGKLYVDEFTGTLPEDAVIEVEEKLLGYIQGGAALSYKPSFYEAKDDLGMVSKKMITDEEAILKSGVMTWNGKTLQKLSSTARVTEDKEKKVRTVKIGGSGNHDGKKYVIHFVHEDNVDGDIRITIVGSNEAGFELAFAKDKETVINAEFKAQPQDNEGTLILYKEEDSSITA